MKYIYALSFLGFGAIALSLKDVRFELWFLFLSTICFIMAASEVIIERIKEFTQLSKQEEK